MTPDDTAAHYRAQTGVIVLDRSWPGLEGAYQESEVDPESLESFANGLQSELERLVDPDSPLSRLDGTEPSAPEWRFGIWEAGVALQNRLADARFYLLEVYRELLVEVENAVALVRQEAEEVATQEETIRRRLDQHAAGGGGDAR